MYLKKLITKPKAKIGIVGLGYVGLPLAINIKKKGFAVYGFDKNKNIINNIKNKKSLIKDVTNKSLNILDKKNLFTTKDLFKIRECDVIIICLPTPLAKNNSPDMSYLKSFLKSAFSHLRKNQMIILESTVYPGATEDVFAKKIKKKFNLGKDFFLAYSPERINPGVKGKIKYLDITKVVSGYSKNCLDLVSLFYKKIFKKIYQTKNIITAEFSKLYENSYRSVNISLANEMKMISDKFNLNIYDIIDASKTKPFGFTSFLPGPGMGGHCIPIDPLFISWSAKKKGFNATFIENSRIINNKIVSWILNKIEKNFSVKNKKILILGVAYKKNVNDERESPALKMIQYFMKKTKNIFYHDPYIKSVYVGKKKVNSINNFSYKNLKYYNAIIICTDHDFYNFKKVIKYSKLVFDTRGVMRTSNYQNKKYITC